MHAVVRTDKMYGTDNRAGLVSVRYQPDDKMTDIDNGNVVKLEALEDGSREVYKGVTPTASDTLNKIVLIDSPEVIYDETKRGMANFYNEAGKISRGYRLHTGDIFSVTEEALEGTPAVGNVVELGDSTKLSVVASETGATVVGKVIDVNTVGRYTFYVVEVE